MTNLAIDHMFFGSGRGMSSPLSDARYYWLVDSLENEGDLYTFGHGHGAQLHSWQWLHPKPGERRCLVGRHFTPLHSRRSGLRVCVAWSWRDLPRGTDEANIALRKMAEEIGRGW